MGNTTSKVTYLYDKRGKLIRTIIEAVDNAMGNKIDPNTLKSINIDKTDLKNRSK